MFKELTEKEIRHIIKMVIKLINVKKELFIDTFFYFSGYYQTKGFLQLWVIGHPVK